MDFLGPLRNCLGDVDERGRSSAHERRAFVVLLDWLTT